MTPAEQVHVALGRQLADSQRLCDLLKRSRRMDKIQVEQLWQQVRSLQADAKEATAWLEALLVLAE